MRTVTFQSIYEDVLGRLGVDPLTEQAQHDAARSIARHATERVRTAWGTWDFPEFTRTEERAYRPTWNDSVQYLRVGEDGLPDEIYYITNGLYYKVLGTAIADPPVGTIPTNATYWEMFTPTQFIERDQTNRRPMGAVLNVYAANPSLNGCCSTSCLNFRPSEKGITICHGPATTVFVQYWMDEPQYTMVPFILGKSYVPGNRVYYATDGNCYNCITSTTSHLPTESAYWVLEPVPSTLAPYLRAGVFSDCAREMPVSPDQAQIRAAAVSAASNEAEEFLGHEIDDLLKQGQKHHWMHSRGRFRNWYGVYQDNVWFPTTGWWCSEPWTGNVVFLLEDAGVDTTTAESCDTSYHPEIVALLTASDTPSLEGLITTTRRITCTLITIAIDVAASPESQQWRLDAGAADTGDPGQIAPTDYDADNPKHWTRVG